MILAAFTHNTDIQFALALVGLILGGVELVRSRATALIAWAVVATALALTLAWWPR